MPPDPYLPTGLWGDEYRDAGGIVVPDYLAEQTRQADARQAAVEAAMAAQQDQERNTLESDQVAQWAQAAKEFVDWPTYLQAAAGGNPQQAYDDYISQALPFHLKRMGYSDEEAQAEIDQFTKMVSRPDADYGFFGNLWESLKSGAKSSTKGLSAAGSLATGDLDALAQSVVDQATGPSEVGPLKKFNEAGANVAGTGTEFSFSDALDSASRFIGAAFTNPEGFANWVAQTAGGQYPIIASSLGGAGIGAAVGGPVGGVLGGGIGMFTTDTALETGSQILQYIQEDAQKAGVDVRDPAALAAYIRQPEVFNELRNAAVAKGLTVGAADTAVTMLSMGLGRAAVLAKRGGKGLRAGGLATAGVVSEPIGSATGEALSQAAAGRGYSYQDIVAELFGDVALGGIHTGAGALLPNREQPGAVPPPTPGDLGDIDESDLPGANQPPPPIPRMDTIVPSQVPFLVGHHGEGAFLGTPENIAARDRAAAAAIGIHEPTVEEITIPPVGPTEPLGVGTSNIEVTELPVEEITILPAKFIDSAEQRIAEGRLLEFQPNPPLTATPAGVVATPQQLEDARIAEATTPQAADLNVKDGENIASWLDARGVQLGPRELAIVGDLAATPAQRKRTYIAEVMEELVASPNANAEPFAQGLLAIARTLPKDPVPKAAEAAQALATDLGVPINQVLPTVTSALAQDVMTAISAGVTDATETTGSTPTAQTAATPVQVKRGLKRGEPIPTPSLSALANQLVGTDARSDEGAGGAAAAQAKPRSGLRSRVAQEGTARRGPVAQTTTGSAAPGATSNRVISDDTSGTPGVPRLVRGVAYGAQPEDVANKEAERAARDEARAKKQTGGLSKKAKAKAKATSKKAYEDLYPGRNFDEELDGLMKGLDPNDGFGAPPGVGGLAPSTVRTIQMSSFSDVMSYLGAVMPNPLARAVANHIATLGISYPIRIVPGLSRPGWFRSMRDGTPAVLLNPETATLETVLHEAIHAATIAALHDPNATPEQARAREEIAAIFEYVKGERTDIAGSYGFRNIEEFLAEAFSSLEFQKELSATKAPGEKVSLLQSLWNAILKLLGIATPTSEVQTALDAIRAAAGPLFTGTPVRAKVELGSAPRKVPSTALLGVKDNARTFIAYPKSKGDPNTLFTLYPTTVDAPGGVKGAGVPALSRQQVEQYITSAGSEFIPSIVDARVAPGQPKNTDKKLVGFSNEGDLRAAAFEQKDGTWTYYQSDADVRTDPDAKVSKGLSRDQAQRYIAQAGFLSEAPTPAAVKPNGDNPTTIGYKPASKARYSFQDFSADFKKIGAAQDEAGHDPTKNVGYLATLNNSRVENQIARMHKQYVKPAIAAGKRVAEAYGKSDAEILDVVKNLHIAERMPVKIQQVLRGNMDPATQATKLNELKKKQAAAEKAVAAQRGANPNYVRMIEQELAPKLKAMSDATLDMQAQYGLLSRDAVEAMKKSYNFYLPLQHGDRTTTGKAATGASVETNEPFARMVEQMDSTISRGERNRVMQALADLVKTSGLINEKTGKPAVFLGSEPVITYDEDTNSLNESMDAHAFDPNTIPYYTQGKRNTMTVVDTPSLKAALAPFSGKDRESVLASLVGMMAWTNRLIAVGKTTLSPMFAPFNFLRDVGTANINLPKGVSRIKFNAELLNPATYGAVIYNVMKEAFGGEPVGGYAAAREAGSFINHRSYVNLDQISHDLDTMFKPRGLRGLNALRKKAQGGVFDALSMISQISESVPRYAMYKAAKSSAHANGLQGKGAEMFAANAAKNASVNFEQRGLHNLSNYWIFGNAKAQGITALLDSAKRAGALKATLGSMGLIALGAVAAGLGYEWSEKDKDGKSKYTKIPNNKKDSMVLFKEGMGIPISQEISPLYVIGNALMEHKLGGTTNTEASSRILTSLMNNFLWPGNVPQQELTGHKANVAEFMLRSLVPSALNPLVDITTNKNTFGSPVVSGLDDKLKKGVPKYEMGSPTEEQLAVNAAKGLHSATGIDMAPQQLKLINNYFNPAAEGYAFLRDMFSDREPKYEGEVVNPILRRFTGNATGFYDQEQFDELRSKAARAKYLAERDGIANLSPEDQALARSAQMLEKVNSDANGLFKGSKLLTQERRALLNDRKRELILDGIRRYNELRDRSVPK